MHYKTEKRTKNQWEFKKIGTLRTPWIKAPALAMLTTSKCNKEAETSPATGKKLIWRKKRKRSLTHFRHSSRVVAFSKNVLLCRWLIHLVPNLAKVFIWRHIYLDLSRQLIYLSLSFHLVSLTRPDMRKRRRIRRKRVDIAWGNICVISIFKLRFRIRWII